MTSPLIPLASNDLFGPSLVNSGFRVCRKARNTHPTPQKSKRRKEKRGQRTFIHKQPDYQSNKTSVRNCAGYNQTAPANEAETTKNAVSKIEQRVQEQNLADGTWLPWHHRRGHKVIEHEEKCAHDSNGEPESACQRFLRITPHVKLKVRANG